MMTNGSTHELNMMNCLYLFFSWPCFQKDLQHELYSLEIKSRLKDLA